VTDPWARAANALARGPGGIDADYYLVSGGPPIRGIRLVLEFDDVPTGRPARPLAGLVPAEAGIGPAQRGDVVTAVVDGVMENLKVEEARPGWRGWGWRLQFSRGR
jgi:hypothetical protein